MTKDIIQIFLVNGQEAARINGYFQDLSQEMKQDVVAKMELRAANTKTDTILVRTIYPDVEHPS